MYSLILKSDFDKIKEFIDSCVKILLDNIILQEKIFLVREGYKNFFIGQKIKATFDDNGFGEYELEGIIIDILIEKEENFGLLIVPEDNENFFPTFNDILKDCGIENLNVPKDGCFLIQHLGRGRFSFNTITKQVTNKVFGITADLTVPELYKIPKETLEKIFIFKKLLKGDLHRSIKRIIE